MSRIITIIEADPITVTSLSIASSSGDNFANAGKTITVTLETDGTDLGNFTGTLLGRDIVKENVNSGGLLHSQPPSSLMIPMETPHSQLLQQTLAEIGFS